MKKYYFLMAFMLIQIGAFANYGSGFYKDTELSASTNAFVITPVFTGIPTSICINTTAPVLPTISTNGISGTWNPAVINTATPGTNFYTFTPNGGQDAETLVLGISIVPSVSIALSSAAPTTNQIVCVNEPILPIVYAVGNSATGATVTGLPAGITGSFVGTTFSIFGAPTVSGVFNYTVTTTGGCGTALMTGTITVAPGGSLTLISAAPTSNQIVCVNTAITNINYAITGSGTGATVTGLPTGITYSYAGGVVTISGTPTAAGVYNYTVVTTGNCGSATATGTITVVPNGTIVLTSGTGSDFQSLCLNAAIAPIVYQVGNGATGMVATGLPLGVSASFSAGNVAVVGVPSEAGTFNYTITTSGGCASASLSGTIVVNDAATTTLFCEPGVAPNEVRFDWSNIIGATAYYYSYTIGDGPLVSGTIVSPSNFTVPNVSAGQNVTFTIAAVDGVTCFAPVTATCLTQPLGTQQFGRSIFKAYPNPVHDLLYIDAEVPVKNVSVFNLLGQKVLSATVSDSKFQINLSGLQKGIYMLQVASDGGMETIKVIKE